MVPERVLVLLAEACDAVILGARRFKHRADHFLGRVVPAVCLRAAKAPRHEWSDSAPLLFIGAASAGFQALLRPKPLDLFKALIVSLAFILWGVDQLLPSGRVATTLGDVVITLYVIDLAWVTIDRLKQRNHRDKEETVREMSGK